MFSGLIEDIQTEIMNNGHGPVTVYADFPSYISCVY